MRFGRLLVAAALLVVPAAAHADQAPSSEIAAGTQLMALDNVILHRAEIAKGSKVAVAGVLKHEGKVDGVSLELADGHVVKVALQTIRNFFRVVE